MNTTAQAGGGGPQGPSLRAAPWFIALFALSACGGDKPPAAPGVASSGTASAGEAQQAPLDARPALQRQKLEVLALAATSRDGSAARDPASRDGSAARDAASRDGSAARDAASRDASLLAKSPLIDATVRVRPGVAGATSTFAASLRFQVPLDGLDTYSRLSFQIAANSAASGAQNVPRVKLDRLEVQGAPATADGTASRWEVAVVGKEGVADLTLHLSGELPSFDERRRQRTLEQELDALPALAHFLPEIPQLDAAEVFGASERLLVLAGALPTLTGTPPAVFSLEVQVDPGQGWTALASGRELADKQGFQRFVGLGHDLAVVLARDLTAARELISGHELTLATHREADTGSPRPSSANPELLRLARRSLESFEDRLGPLEGSTLTLLVTEELDELGAAALPGLVLLPRRHGPLAPPRPAAKPAENDWLARVDLLLAHHPGPREAYERAIATAIARLPWVGWDTGPLGRLVEHGLAADSAMRTLRASLGEKAQRRALELGWRLPYQLGRMRGAPDPALITVEPAEDPNFAQVARAKSGLAFEALARALGDPPWTSLGLALRDARQRGTPLTEALVLDQLTRHAPRPEVATGLWTRWTHERRGDTDVGELRPEVLLEYLVTDGAVTGLSHALMDNAGELAGSPLGQKALARLGAGESLDSGFAIAMLGELLGPSLDPTSRRWLELGTGLFSKESRKSALEGLIDELGGELGIPEADRARLGQLGGLVLDALAAPDPTADPVPAP